MVGAIMKNIYNRPAGAGNAPLLVLAHHLSPGGGTLFVAFLRPVRAVNPGPEGPTSLPAYQLNSPLTH